VGGYRGQCEGASELLVADLGSIILPERAPITREVIRHLLGRLGEQAAREIVIYKGALYEELVFRWAATRLAGGGGADEILTVFLLENDDDRRRGVGGDQTLVGADEISHGSSRLHLEGDRTALSDVLDGQRDLGGGRGSECEVDEFFRV
jgi:hypothetical protein